MHRIASWWDALELWIAGLPFVPQVIVVLGAMLPVSYLIATTLDRALARVLDTVRNSDHRAAERLPGDQWKRGVE